MRWPGRQGERDNRKGEGGSSIVRRNAEGRAARAQSLNKSDPFELRRPPHLASLGSPRRTCVPWGPLLLFSRRRPCSIFAILVRGAAAYVLLLRLIFRSIDLLPSPLLFLQFVEIGKVPSVPWEGEGAAAEAVSPFETKGLSAAAHE